MKSVTVYLILYEFILEFLHDEAFYFWRVLFFPFTEVFHTKFTFWNAIRFLFMRPLRSLIFESASRISCLVTEHYVFYQSLK